MLIGLGCRSVAACVVCLQEEKRRLCVRLNSYDTLSRKWTRQLDLPLLPSCTVPCQGIVSIYKQEI